MRDFDLLGNGDWFGVTVTSALSEQEPNAALLNERLKTLYKANLAGIKTWASFEPVVGFSGPETVFSQIKFAVYIDLYRIGKTNYYPSDVDWAKFGKECLNLAQKHGKNVKLKSDLQKIVDEASLLAERQAGGCEDEV